ncbi:MAG: hypothetical protein QM805_07625 [Pseudomonas sp.]
MSDTEEEKIEIEVVDDTPPEDRNRKPPADVPEGDPDEDEIAQYSANVQKRIKQLTFKANEERRHREAAERERDEAANLAKRALADATTYRQNAAQGENLFVEQAKQRVAAQIEQAKKVFKEAYESGDADALVKAQSDLTSLQNEEFRLKSYRPQQVPKPQPAAQQQPQTAQPTQTQPVTQTPTVPKPSARAEEWAKKNDWFGKPGSEDMTAQAFVAHERAINSGVAPDSDEYYAAIDKAVRNIFPDRFSGADDSQQQRQRVGVVVAPASRVSGQNPRKVVLTQTQVSLAKRLGLTVEQYAAQLLKEQKNG